MGRERSILPLAGIVLIHLGLNVAHGWAHVAADVRLGPVGMAFVLLVIILGPLTGLAWMRVNPQAGALIIAATMTAALVFGFANHFAIPGADHVAHVAAAWRLWFATTAALLAIAEAAGAILATAYAWGPARSIA